MGIHGKVKAFLAATVLVGASFVAVPHAAASNPTVFDSPGWIFNQSNGAYEILSTTSASWFVGGIYPGSAGPFESYAASPYVIVAAAESPDNKGYWTVDSRGSLIGHWFALQNRYYGSTYGMKNTAPIVALASSPSGYGYFEIAADGGVFSFGDAVFRGSLAGQALAAPIVAATYTDDGYILIDAAGNAYPFSAAGQQPTIPGSTRSFAISISKSLAAPGGYWILDADGSVRAILGAENFGDAAPNPGAIAVDIRGAAVGSYRVLYSDGVVKSFGGLQDAIGGVLDRKSVV